MGQSTDAILVYGIQLTTDADEELPAIFIGEDEDDILDGWGDDSVPYELITHCSFDYPMYILAVNGTQTRAWRGEPKVIKDLLVSQKQLIAFHAWCDNNGIEGKPEWLLASMWG